MPFILLGDVEEALFNGISHTFTRRTPLFQNLVTLSMTPVHQDSISKAALTIGADN